MEDRAKCFHLSASIVRSSRKDILPGTTRDRAGEKKKKKRKEREFTVFKDAYRAKESEEQIRPKKQEFCILIFPVLTQCFLFVLLLAGHFSS